ncbi:MFS transporter [Methylobacterium planeticum]|uniref:MFS transporter n=2 Tax=Methylobacterium planeticum TaxID=2615211 RepID=A0A6N6MYS7_9HYPH|nr:MFS transporter [Methylobacterium planeticum]
MLVAFNLRPALTTVGPLLTAIRADTGLSASGAAVLTTLPVLFLGLASATGPAAIRRLGVNRGILLAIVIVAAGLASRAIGGIGPLFFGACLSAAGIGLAGVLLPGLVKRDFPRHAGLMTGLYTMVLCLGAAAGAGLTVPLQDALGAGWALPLAAWAIPALVAALAWTPFSGREQAAAPAPIRSPRRAWLWRDPLAWQVTGFMGLQSSLAYIMFGWIPALLQSRGLSALDAGFIASLMSIGQAPVALLVPTFAARAGDQRAYATGLILLTVTAFLGVVYAPIGFVGALTIALGFGLGGTFGLGLTIIVLRARDTAGAAGLSAMAQGIGYSIAALGPLGFGLAHEAGGDWTLSVVLFCAIALAGVLCGLGAGRNRQVGAG